MLDHYLRSLLYRAIRGHADRLATKQLAQANLHQLAGLALVFYGGLKT